LTSLRTIFFHFLFLAKTLILIKIVKGGAFLPNQSDKKNWQIRSILM